MELLELIRSERAAINFARAKKSYISKDTLTGKITFHEIEHFVGITDVGSPRGHTEVNIGNSIDISDEIDFSAQKEEEAMRKEILKKDNVTATGDGRYRYQKMQNGTRYDIKERDPKLFLKKMSELKKALKDNKDIKAKVINPKAKYILVGECKKYVALYKGNNDDGGKHKRKLEGAIVNHMAGLTKDARAYTQDDMQKFRNGLSEFKKVDKMCMLILKPVFDNLVLRRVIPMSPLTGTKSKAKKQGKRSWIHINDQKTILDNIFNPATDEIRRYIKKVGDFILFCFLSGCRDEEGVKYITPFWSKGLIHIDGTKTDNATRYVKMSSKACEYFRARWDTFCSNSKDPHYYSKNTTKLLAKLGISGKSLHCARHSFCTNLDKLGVAEEERQYFMGHSDKEQTRGYTTFDPTVDKDDILAVWGDWYPTDFVLKSVLSNVTKNDK